MTLEACRQVMSLPCFPELADGEIEFSLKLGTLTEIQRWILSWGEHAQVIAPPELCSRIARTITAMNAKYTQP